MANAHDLDILAWTMLGEAGGEGRDGMADVGHVVLNRLESGRYGASIADVARAPKQFSTWNSGVGGNNPQGRYPKSSPEFKQARAIAEQVVSGAIPGPPGKPLDYHTPSISPYWADSKDRYGTYTRNGHLFYPSVPVPPAEIPNVVATQTDTQRPTQVMGQAQAPTSPASRMAQTRDVTPRLAPGNADLYSYHIPDITPASLVGGAGSLTPTIGQRPPIQMPRPRPVTPSDIASVPYSQGQNIAMAPTTPRQLPPIPPAPPSARDVALGVERGNAAASQVDPALRAALARQTVPASVVDQSIASGLAAVDPGLQRALEARNGPGVGQPPATRTVASVAALPTITGPSAPPKSQDRLAAGNYPMPPIPVPDMGVASALSVTPGIPGFPPLPRARPVMPTMPTPMGQRPTLPAMAMSRPVFGMPTALSQRPIPQPTMRIAVNGANSYGGAPPMPQAFRGTSGRGVYTPNQQYVMGGQTFVANPNGSFTNLRTGQVLPGSSRREPDRAPSGPAQSLL